MRIPAMQSQDRSARRPAPPLLLKVAWYLASLTLLASTHVIAAGLFGSPSYTQVACTGQPEVGAVLDVDFNVVLTFCSSDPEELSAAALFELAYATRGNSLTNPSLYGNDEVRVTFDSNQNQVLVPIEGILGGLPQVVGVMVTTYRTSGNSPSARLIGNPIQLQGYEVPGHQFDPDQTLALTQDERTLLADDLLGRNYVLPAGAGGANCGFVHSDLDISTIDNRGRNSWRMVHSAKVMCAMDYDVIPPRSCKDSGGQLPAAGAATHCATMATAAPPETCHLLNSRGLDAQGEVVTTFKTCCDPAEVTYKSKVVMQAARTVVTEKILPDGSSRILDPFFWADVATDIHPSDIGTQPPSAVEFSWFDFAGPAPSALSPPKNCMNNQPSLPADLQDQDGDGIFDTCDFMTPSETTVAGGNQVLLHHSLRHEAFNDVGPSLPSFSGVPEVRVGSAVITYPELVAAPGQLTITVPSGLPTGALPLEVCPDAECSTPGVSRDLLSIRRKAYVAIGGMNYVRPIDELTGEFLDIDPSYSNAVPDLPVSGPGDVVFSSEAGSENKEVLIAAGDELFIYDDPNHVFLDQDEDASEVQGVPLGGDILRLSLESHGEFLFALHGQRDLTVLDVRRVPGPPGTTNPRFMKYAVSGLSSGAIPSHLAVRSLTGHEYMVYATFSCLNCGHLLITTPACSSGPIPPAAPMGGITPCPPQGCEGGEPGGGGGSGGGSGGPRRYVGLAAVRLKAHYMPDGETLLSGSDAFTEECYEDIVLSAYGGVTGEELPQGALPWYQLGMDFSTDGEELYIVNPETDSVFVLDTTTNELVAPGGVPVEIPVGPTPIELEVLLVKDESGSAVDRAYVIDAELESLITIDTLGREVKGAVSLSSSFPGLPSYSVSSAAGSEDLSTLYLVASDSYRVLRYTFSADVLPGASADSPMPLLPPVLVGPSPRRIALPR